MVQLALDLAIIHGPPGTGKTHTLIHTIVQSLKKEKQVMVSAPSNLAVDLLIEKLAMAGVNVVRIGHPARISDMVLQRSPGCTVCDSPGKQDDQGTPKGS